jgi:uncharacterized protein (DUF2267 family)
MRHDEFIATIQDRAQLPSRAVAERVAAVTVETLAERIPADLAEDLAERLPHRVGVYLRRRPLRTSRFDRRGFFARVHERADGPEPAAAYGARVVLEVLAETVAQETAGSANETDPAAADLVGRLYRALPQDLRHLVRHRDHVRS